MMFDHFHQSDHGWAVIDCEIWKNVHFNCNDPFFSFGRKKIEDVLHRDVWNFVSKKVFELRITADNSLQITFPNDENNVIETAICAFDSSNNGWKAIPLDMETTINLSCPSLVKHNNNVCVLLNIRKLDAERYESVDQLFLCQFRKFIDECSKKQIYFCECQYHYPFSQMDVFGFVSKFFTKKQGERVNCKFCLNSSNIIRLQVPEIMMCRPEEFSMGSTGFIPVVFCRNGHVANESFARFVRSKFVSCPFCFHELFLCYERRV